MELNTCFLAKSGCPLVDPKGALTKRLLDFVHGAVGVQSSYSRPPPTLLQKSQIVDLCSVCACVSVCVRARACTCACSCVGIEEHLVVCMDLLSAGDQALAC